MARSQWDGKVTGGQNSGISQIKGTAKEHEMKRQRQQYARREAEATKAVAEIEAARFARLPWPVRAIGVVPDFVLRRAVPVRPDLRVRVALGCDTSQLDRCYQASNYSHHPISLLCPLVHHRLPWSVRITSQFGCPRNTSVVTMYDLRSRQTGQITVTEPITASTEMGMHRLHPLQRTTWTRFRSGPNAMST